MNIELENKLFEKYPTLFPGGRKVNPKESLMLFGFEVSDGWFSIIDKLCSDILKTKDGDKIVVEQVKEKFGGLRFYVRGAYPIAYDLISKAEEDSFKICEECGKPGKQTKINGWMKTLCEVCEKNESI